MKYITSEGVVLRYADYKENDRLVTLLTPELGRITVSMRGVKKPTAKLRFAAELFNRGIYELSESGGRYTVTGCTPADTYYPLRADLERLWCAMLAANVCEAVSTEHQSQQELFELFTDTLHTLAYNDDMTWQEINAAFLLKFLDVAGFAPELDACVVCGKSTDGCFSPERGGLVCRDCAGEGLPRIFAPELDFLRAVRSGEEIKTDVRTALKCCRLLMQDVQYCMDRRFKTAEFLYKV